MLVAPAFFASNMVFGRATIPAVAPFTLAFVRWLLVGLILLPAVLRQWPIARAVMHRHWRKLFFSAFLGMWICGGVVYLALRYTTATNGTLIFTISTVFIILFEAILGTRRLRWRDGLGSLIALAGVVVIVLKGRPGALLDLAFNGGDLLFLLAAIAWAIYSIAARSSHLSELDNFAQLALTALAGAALLLPFSAAEWFRGLPMPVSAHAWSGIAGIVVFSSLLAFSCFQFGVRALGPSLAGVFMYLLPPYGVILATAFLGESVAAYHLAGIAMVMGGVVLATLPKGWPTKSAAKRG
jgi:drug/metabolite transporter (DMT)-like permease